MPQDLDSKDELIKSLRTELKTAQKNEQRLTTLIQSAPVCIHEINLKGQITSMNGTGLNMMGMQSEKEICGIYYMDFVCKKQKDQINQLLERAYTGEYHAFEFNPENSELIFSSCFAPVFNNDGDVVRIMGITENVTEQRQNQSKLRENEIKFRNMFENSDISVWNEDMSDLKNALDLLRIAGVTDLNKYLIEHPQKTLEFAFMIKVVNVNSATLKLFNATTEQGFLEKIPKSFGATSEEVFIKELCAIWDGKKEFRTETTFTTFDGKDIEAILFFYTNNNRGI